MPRPVGLSECLSGRSSGNSKAVPAVVELIVSVVDDMTLADESSGGATEKVSVETANAKSNPTLTIDILFAR